MDMNFFGVASKPSREGPDDKLNEMIEWMNNVDRKPKEYMEKEGLKILIKNGYISVKKHTSRRLCLEEQGAQQRIHQQNNTRKK